MGIGYGTDELLEDDDVITPPLEDDDSLDDSLLCDELGEDSLELSLLELDAELSLLLEDEYGC